MRARLYLASPCELRRRPGLSRSRTDLRIVGPGRILIAYLRKGGLQSGRPDRTSKTNPLDTPVERLPSESSGSGARR